MKKRTFIIWTTVLSSLIVVVVVVLIIQKHSQQKRLLAIEEQTLGLQNFEAACDSIFSELRTPDLTMFELTGCVKSVEISYDYSNRARYIKQPRTPIGD